MSKIEDDNTRKHRISMEILSDADNIEEQLMGWYRYLEDKLHFPFQAKWLTRGSTAEDEDVKVLEMSAEDDCQDEMFVEVLYREDMATDVFSVPLSHLKVVEADEQTQQAIADWHYWVDKGYQV